MGLKIIAIDSSWSILNHDLVGPFASLGSFLSWGHKSCRVDSVSDMVSKVLKIAGGEKIEKLAIVGHGRPGWQSVGCGRMSDATGYKSLQFVEGTAPAPPTLVGAAAMEIPKLAGHFTNNGMVILAGCNVADTGPVSYFGVPITVDGKNLLRAVSRALVGISVAGATAFQNQLSPYAHGQVIRCSYDSFMVVSPNILGLNSW
jgi:hypothetical protein